MDKLLNMAIKAAKIIDLYHDIFICQRTHTVGSQIMFFHSMLFSDVDKKKNQFLARATVSVEFAHSHVCAGFLHVVWFPPHPKDVYMR